MGPNECPICDHPWPQDPMQFAKHVRMHMKAAGLTGGGELMIHLIKVAAGKETLRSELEPQRDKFQLLQNIVSQKGEQGKIIGRTTVQTHKSGPSDGTWATRKKRRP